MCTWHWQGITRRHSRWLVSLSVSQCQTVQSHLHRNFLLTAHNFTSEFNNSRIMMFRAPSSKELYKWSVTKQYQEQHQQNEANMSDACMDCTIRNSNDDVTYNAMTCTRPPHTLQFIDGSYSLTFYEIQTIPEHQEHVLEDIYHTKRRTAPRYPNNFGCWTNRTGHWCNCRNIVNPLTW